MLVYGSGAGFYSINGGGLGSVNLMGATALNRTSTVSGRFQLTINNDKYVPFTVNSTNVILRGISQSTSNVPNATLTVKYPLTGSSGNTMVVPDATLTVGGVGAELLTVNEQGVETDLSDFDSYNCTLTRDTTQHYSGSASAKGVATDAFAQIMYYGSPTGFTPGESYISKAWVRADVGTLAAQQISIIFEWLVGGAHLSYDYVPVNVSDFGELTWHYLQYTSIVPATADGLIVSISFFGDVNDIFWYDSGSLKEVTGTETDNLTGSSAIVSNVPNCSLSVKYTCTGSSAIVSNVPNCSLSVKYTCTGSSTIQSSASGNLSNTYVCVGSSAVTSNVPSISLSDKYNLTATDVVIQSNVPNATLTSTLTGSSTVTSTATANISVKYVCTGSSAVTSNVPNINLSTTYPCTGSASIQSNVPNISLSDNYILTGTSAIVSNVPDTSLSDKDTLTGTSSIQSSASANLTNKYNLTATDVAIQSNVPNANETVGLTGSSSITSTVTANISVKYSCTGSSTIQSSTSANLTNKYVCVGSSAVTSNVPNINLTNKYICTGTSTIQSNVPNATLTVVNPDVDSLTGTSTILSNVPNINLSDVYPLVGTASIQSGLTASLTNKYGCVGTSTGVSSVTNATLTQLYACISTVSCISNVVDTTLNNNYILTTNSVSIHSSVADAILSTCPPLIGTSSITSTTTASLSDKYALGGSSAIAMNVPLATLTVIQADIDSLTGSSHITSSTSGNLTTKHNIIGTSDIELSASATLKTCPDGVASTSIHSNVPTALLSETYPLTSIVNAQSNVIDATLLQSYDLYGESDIVSEVFGSIVESVYIYGVHTSLKVVSPSTKIGVDMKYKTKINIRTYKTILTVVME